MIIYLLKTTICSALLLIIYFLLLEKENMHRFKRAYLLLSIIASYTLPFLVFHNTPDSIPVAGTIELVQTNIYQRVEQQTKLPDAQTNFLYIILSVIYFTISSLLLFRFIRNIIAMIKKIKAHPQIDYNNAVLVLTPEKIITHSFLKYIFINKDDHENKSKSNVMLHHELTHVKQKHSLDILFLESILIVAWINPVLYLYKKAIQLNHEFLADQQVVSTFHNIRSYQHLLLSVLSSPRASTLASSFNFSITKKRFVMMTTSTSVKIAALKKIAMLPLFAAVVFLFSTRTSAQDPVKPTQPAAKKEAPPTVVYYGQSIGATKEGVTPELLKEYQSIISKYKTGKKWPNTFSTTNITQDDRNRLEAIYKQMSPDQQDRQPIGFVIRPKPLPKVVPTSAQIETWKDSKTYGLWINGKRTDNSKLNEHVNTDFAQVFISKLSINAINYGKHYYQVDLMTSDYYREYYNRNVNNKQSLLVIKSYKKD